MKRILNLSIVLVICALLYGCAWGNQAVVWSKSEPVDFSKKVFVNVAKDTRIPDNEIGFLKNDITNEVSKIFSNSQGGYNLNITITRYDEGAAG